MRTAKTLITSLCIVLLGAVDIFAQEQRIGFIDSNSILEQIPEYGEVEERLDLLSESWQNEIESLNVTIEEMQREYEAREPLYTEEVRQQRRSEIESRINERDQLTDEKYGPDGEYFLYQQELLEPIQRRVYNALQAVAIRNEFDFVFDRSEDVRFLYANSRWNLTDEVMLELGISQNE